jgi:hypothetical protein
MTALDGFIGAGRKERALNNYRRQAGLATVTGLINQ